jgi:hypothetical protein
MVEIAELVVLCTKTEHFCRFLDNNLQINSFLSTVGLYLSTTTLKHVLKFRYFACRKWRRHNIMRKQLAILLLSLIVVTAISCKTREKCPAYGQRTPAHTTQRAS